MVGRIGWVMVAGVLATACLLAAPPLPLAAQDPACTAEVEPNDNPDALTFVSGTLCVEGTLPASDQDLLLWELSPEEAARPWTITVDGIEGTLTGLQIVSVASEPGVIPVVAGTRIIGVDAPPSAFGPVVRDGVLLPAGRLIVGISRSTYPDGGEPEQTGYRFSLQPGDPLPAPSETEPNDTPDAANPVAGAFDRVADASLDPDYLAWTVEGTPEGTAWTLTLTGTIGRSVAVSLVGADGFELASAQPDVWGVATLTDLQLPQGTYTLYVSGSPTEATPYRLTAATGPVVAGADPEPNDRLANLVPLDPAAPLARGRLHPADDRDLYRLSVPADAAPVMRDIKLLGPDDLWRSLCLARLDGTTIQCRDGAGGSALRSLVLAPGDYLVVVTGDPDAERPYALRIDETSGAVPDFELEPNDDASTATPFEPSIVMRGLGGAGETDVFRLTTTGEPQLWEVRLAGTGVERLAWIRADGQVLAEGAVDLDHANAVATDLYLVPGDHWFRSGGGGDYRISATPLGPPDPEAEREPNNDAAFAQPYRLGRTQMLGRLPSPVDRDVFRFSLAAAERVVLRLEPAADGAVSMRLETGGQVLARRGSVGPGVPIAMEVLLGPGDHEIWLGADTPSEGRYRLTLERGDPLLVRADEEPNDRYEQATPLGASMVVTGELSAGDEYDWFRLPELDPATPVTVRFTGGVTGAALGDGFTVIPPALDGDALVLTSDGMTGIAPRYLYVRGSGPYTLRVEAPRLVAVPAPDPLPITATLSTTTDTVAAYWPSGQRIGGTLTLRNDGAAPLDLGLDAVTSHVAWSALPVETAVSLGAGETREIPVDVVIGPDAWADEPVRITVRARDDAGSQVTTAATVTPAGDADPVAPEQAWSVPEALLGGLDVASLALGAVTMPAIDPVEEDQLHDGKAHTGLGFSQSITYLPVTLGVDLAGDVPVPVAGFAIDPQAAEAFPGDVPRDVEFLLSTDGITYAPAMTATVSTRMGDQWFVLPGPVLATHAQLRIDSVQGGGFAQVILGEWKVIATPGTAPASIPLDLAQPMRGGHVAWMEPQSPDPGWFSQWLDEDPVFTQLYLEAGTGVSWAVGFADARAAQVTELQWVDPVPSTDGQRFAAVEVEASLEGAAGPWRPLGTWTLERAGDGTVAPFVLPEPAWARYLRFTGQGPRKETSFWDPPATIRVLEHPTDGGYRSILGEWGAGEPVGPHEWLVPPDVGVPPIVEDDDDTPETASRLVAGTRATGRVDGRTDLDWYTFDVPEGHNTVDLTVTGKPIVAVALTLVDTEGFEVPMLFRAGDTPGTVRYEAEVTPGTYRLRVEQPVSSIVFTFDTSGSMGPYLEYVYQAMRAFTADVTPGEEAVSIVPFEEDPLLEDWSDDPFTLADAVGRVVSLGGSSSVETALIDAATELSVREGARAILVVTDGETSSFADNAELWRILGSARPLVTAVHVGATYLPDVTTVAMQDFARAAGGFYQYTRSHGEMDRAFDRLATWLRRPAGYALDLATSFRETPPESAKPGSIAVTSPADGSVSISPDVGVEIILDTSGSMLKEIKGKRRIDLAKTVLADLVTNRLPAGAPVAVRVLGDEVDVCGTRLVVPLGPLDAEAVVRDVNGIDVVQEADTALGAALRAVPEDLAGSTGTRIVLLITDSEEVWPHPDLCGDDPAAAVRDLRRRGIDARLNIVGLQVKAKKATSQLKKWARLGNGSFFSANDAEQLGRSIRTAVSAPFRILDTAGNEVASGTVDGASVPVKPGVYSVVVLTDPVVRFDGIEIEPDEGESLQLPDATPPPSLEPLAEPAP